jgi:hypothetical protein
MTAGTRLADVLPLLEADHRLQVSFTIPTASDMWDGVQDYVRRWGGLILPWAQVVRTRFDLALASSYRDIDAIDAPVMVLPHGVGGSRSRMSPGPAANVSGQVERHPRDLLVRDGRIVPEAVVFAHQADADRLCSEFPAAAPRTLVAGDVCFDRLQASRQWRASYRDALRVRADQKLILISSTWSRHSLFGTNPQLLNRLVARLDSRNYRVVAALHPLIWSAHGAWQVRSWLAGALEGGLGLLFPEDGWRAAVVAADCVVGDHGSVTQYAAALEVPVLLNSGSALDVCAGSIAARLWEAAPTLRAGCSLRRQVDDVIAAGPSVSQGALAALITSRPGKASAELRRAMYRILGITEPAHDAPLRPVSPPARVLSYRHTKGEVW